MDQSTVDKIQQMEAFQKLTKTRSSYNWTMAYHYDGSLFCLHFVHRI